MSDILDENLFEDDQEYRFKFKLRPILIWSGFIVLGFLFKIMHWPGLVLLVVCPAGLTAYSFSGLITLKGSNVLNNILSGLGIVWFLILIWGLIFNDGNPLNIYGIGVYLGTLLVFILFYELMKWFRRRKSIKKGNENRN